MLLGEKLKAHSLWLSQQILSVQDGCLHPTPAVTRVKQASTGNWCPDDDRYWQDCHCQLCDKHWTEPQ